MNGDPLNDHLLRRAHGLCTAANCTGPGKHAVAHDGHDSGHRLCCECLDDLMVAVAHEQESADAGTGEAGLRSFAARHRGECGHKVAVGLFARFRVEQRERAAAEAG